MGYVIFETENGDLVINNKLTSRIGIGMNNPTAVLQLAGGLQTPNSAPLKFTSGTNLTTPEPGAVEYDGPELYFTK